MDLTVFETFGKIAGVGGLGLGVMLLIFRRAISELVLGQGGVPRAKRYPLMRLILILVWSVAVLGIAAWAYPSIISSHNGVQAALCNGTPVTELRVNGWDAFRQGNFETAERIAGKLYSCNNKDAAAYNIQGAVAFFERKYDRAVDKFRQAYSLAPSKQGAGQNLADALVESAMTKPSGDERNKKLAEAIAIYEDLKTGEWSIYKIARANLFLRKHDEALSEVRKVGDFYDAEGGIGKARILEGAIYACMVLSASDQGEAVIAKSKNSFARGFELDPSFWREIVVNKRFHKPEPFEHVLGCYGDRIKSWINPAA
jgi:hypothetical protein